MALELVRHKILVNAVAPGAIATPMNGMDDSDVKPDAEPSIPLRRFGATHEIASLVVWLCSEGANYTTGQSLICLLYTSPSPRDRQKSRMPSSA